MTALDLDHTLKEAGWLPYSISDVPKYIGKKAGVLFLTPDKQYYLVVRSTLKAQIHRYVFRFHPCEKLPKSIADKIKGIRKHRDHKVYIFPFSETDDHLKNKASLILFRQMTESILVQRGAKPFKLVKKKKKKHISLYRVTHLPSGKQFYIHPLIHIDPMRHVRVKIVRLYYQMRRKHPASNESLMEALKVEYEKTGQWYVESHFKCDYVYTVPYQQASLDVMKHLDRL